jgi:hypothetical protein
MTDYYKGKPFVQDFEKWKEHFRKMVRGELRPDGNGNYHVAPLPRDYVKKSKEPQVSAGYTRGRRYREG